MIADALAILRAGGVVGMPTETVYGLAADARSDVAVRRVFELKGRPSTNPLIVHVADVGVAARYAMLDDRARRLFAAFAPGPLTIVLPRLDGICDLATAELDTVGIRIPDHPVALALLRAFDGPLAAPSANVSNRVSPTTADHVREAFGDAVPVLDGGPCRVGIESTVLSLAGGVPVILRPGSVSREAIEAVIGAVEVQASVVAPSVAARSPGQHATHYAPRAPAFRLSRSMLERTVRQISSASNATAERSACAVIALAAMDWARCRAIGDDPVAAASAFYRVLREVDATGPEFILIEMPPDSPRWAALRDRIGRATVEYEPDALN